MTQNAKKAKLQKMQMRGIFTKSQKNENGNVCILYHNSWTNKDLDLKTDQNDHRNLSFVKEGDAYGKKMARNGAITIIYE